MKKLLGYILSLLLAPCLALAQPSVNGPMFGPNWPSGFVPSPQQWQLLWTNKLDYYAAGLPIDAGGTGAITAAGAAANLGLMSNALTNGRMWLGNGSNVATAVLMSGDCTVTNAGVMTCVQKTLANGQVWIGNGSNVATAHALSGDCTMTNAGVVTCVSSLPLTVGTTGINSGTTNGLLFTTSGAKLGNIATANSGLLVTDGSGVPSLGTAIPNGVTATTQATTDNTTKVATTAFVMTHFPSVINITKITASGTAPGAGNGKLEWVVGTNAGTCKLIAYGGTSVTAVTVIDNVGTGC